MILRFANVDEVNGQQLLSGMITVATMRRAGDPMNYTPNGGPFSLSDRARVFAPLMTVQEAGLFVGVMNASLILNRDVLAISPDLRNSEPSRIAVFHAAQAALQAREATRHLAVLINDAHLSAQARSAMLKRFALMPVLEFAVAGQTSHIGVTCKTFASAMLSEWCCGQLDVFAKTVGRLHRGEQRVRELERLLQTDEARLPELRHQSLASLMPTAADAGLPAEYLDFYTMATERARAAGRSVAVLSRRGCWVVNGDGVTVALTPTTVRLLAVNGVANVIVDGVMARVRAQDTVYATNNLRELREIEHEFLRTGAVARAPEEPAVVRQAPAGSIDLTAAVMDVFTPTRRRANTPFSPFFAATNETAPPPFDFVVDLPSDDNE